MSKIGKYKIHETIGVGSSCKVKIATDTENEQKVAIKIMRQNLAIEDKQLILNEVRALMKIKHENVLEIIEFGAGIYEKESGKNTNVNFVVLKLAQGGQLFDYVSLSGKFAEAVARYFFKQLLEGLYCCHQKGICHRDLKPENILLDDKYCLKIADFGFAAPIQGRDGSGTLMTCLGTYQYMAPEIILNQPYEGEKVDLFASAIILFTMVAGRPPFFAAQPSDPFFKILAASQNQLFWKIHEKQIGETFSPELKSLLDRMFSLIPADRPSLEKLSQDPWLQGKSPNQEEIYMEFQKRENLIKNVPNTLKQQNEEIKNNCLQPKKVMRSGSENQIEMENQIVHEKILNEGNFDQRSQFPIDERNADKLEQRLIQYLEEIEVDLEISDKKYKISFKIELYEEDFEFELFVDLRILQKNNGLCVQARKIQGDQIKFNQWFQEFKNTIIS